MARHLIGKTLTMVPGVLIVLMQILKVFNTLHNITNTYMLLQNVMQSDN